MLPKPKSISDWQEQAKDSPEAAANALLGSIAAIPPDIRKRVFAAVPSLSALTTAFESSSRIKNQPLAGVPFLLKDLYDYPGYPTTASSSFLPEVRPDPPEESALSIVLRSAGGVFAGKTHLNEFAYGLSGENKTFGDCPHPLFPSRVSGGSSSGSAWAVKRGIVPIATGTDTGGSIRVPAAWCGLYGLRLSPNEWSTKGCFPLAPSFDTAGWLTATASDMATSIQALIGGLLTEKKHIRGLNLINAFPRISRQYRNRSLDTIAHLNLATDSRSTAEYQNATQDVALSYAVLQSIDAYQVHQPWLDSHKTRYDPVVWQRLDRARNWTSKQIDTAKQGERRIKAFFESAFRDYDFVALPATQSPAIAAADHTDSFRNELLSINAPGSFARCPILTVPVQLESGESLGVQILYKDQTSALPLQIVKGLA